MLFPSPCKIFIKIKGRSHSPNWQHSTSRRPGETKTNQESIETAYQVVEHISYDHMIYIYLWLSRKVLKITQLALRSRLGKV